MLKNHALTDHALKCTANERGRCETPLRGVKKEQFRVPRSGASWRPRRSAVRFSAWSVSAWFFLFGLFALVSSAGAADKPPVGGTVRDEVGVNIHFTDPQPGEMEMLGGAGFGAIRMDLTWDSTEKTLGVYDFSAYDRLMTALDRYKIRPLFILDYGNPLYDDKKMPYTDAGRAAFAKWAVAAATHFKGRHILWEMWNEPNWNKTDDDYAKLAVAVGKALREALPNETYIGPAEGSDDSGFLTTCFQAGALDYWQAVSIHPYRSTAPETVAPEYQRVSALIAQYAPPGKTIPILAGEWGYTVITHDTYSHVTTEAAQASYFDREVLSNIELGIPLTIWYDWHDDGSDPQATEGNFGLVHNAYHAGRTPVYDPKPSYIAAQTLLTTLGSYRYAGSLMLTGATTDARVLSFANRKQHRYAAWTTAAAPEAVTVPVPAGKYTLVNLTGDVKSVVTAGRSGLPLTLTGDVQFLVPGTL